MSKLNAISHFAGQLGATIASYLKVALLSRRPTGAPQAAPGAEIVILGNGPSLRQTMADSMPQLMQRDRLAVNFAANAPEFSQLRQQLYVLADPHFFHGDSDPNVQRLWQNIAAVDWPMTLFVPVKERARATALLHGAKSVTISTYNLTPAEGFAGAVYPLYRAGLAMPRPRNVLIPGIMLALRAGYKRILIAGADHTWSKTLDVDDQNRVISVQPHFYKDGKGEQKRVNTEYAGYHLHDILLSLHIAFKAYHRIAAYAKSLGARILNITPGSMIDAFPRASL